MKALLFDIDGTLLNGHGLGRKAFEQALKDATGINTDISGVDWLGRTDTDIISTILESQGFDEGYVKYKLPEIFYNFVKYFKEFSIKNKDQFEIIPFVREILEELKNEPLGLLTGNVMESAYIKLSAREINIYFPHGIGGFGDEDRVRSRLVPIAVGKMKEYYSVKDFDEIIVIGDSHRDIECAKANNVISFAVATGKMTLYELKKYKPDYLYQNFEDIDKITEILKDHSK